MAKHPSDFERHTRGDGRRFHVRVQGEQYQVFGFGLEHLALCDTWDLAQMVADALERVASDVDRVAELERRVGHLEVRLCTCPTLDGHKVTGSSCPVHGLPVTDGL